MDTPRRPVDAGDAWLPVVRFPIRRRLVLLSVFLLVLVSFGFMTLNLALTRSWVEEDLRYRAIAFAREIAATIGDYQELENAVLLQEQIRQVLAARQNVSQLDILAFGGGGAKIVPTSHVAGRLPLTREEGRRVQEGQVISRLIEGAAHGRYWEVVAPIRLHDLVAGAVAARFSLERADRLASRIRRSAVALTAASVLLMGLLMSVTVRLVVDRPIRRFLAAIARLREGDSTATVDVAPGDEFGVLASHFNEMMKRVGRFNDELRARVSEATAALDTRYREVERLNATLFDMQRSLSRAERLAVSGRIMAEVAHEIGTPLHSVAGHLELLRRDLPPELLQGDLARRLAVMETQLARMTEIIAQLLDLTRRVQGPPGAPARVDLNRVVRETVDLVRPAAAGAGLHLDVDTDPDLPPVRGFAGQLQQVMLNLLTNAIDATPPGGKVLVTTRERPPDDSVEVAVTDSGRGIPLTDQKQIFEPFFSTKEPGRGTGLGLFISSQIVRDHRGRIEVESEKGQGSRLCVTLPVDREP
jgi:signal transduction histidine kinase